MRLLFNIAAVLSVAFYPLNANHGVLKSERTAARSAATEVVAAPKAPREVEKTVVKSTTPPVVSKAVVSTPVKQPSHFEELSAAASEAWSATKETVNAGFDTVAGAVQIANAVITTAKSIANTAMHLCSAALGAGKFGLASLKILKATSLITYDGIKFFATFAV